MINDREKRLEEALAQFLKPVKGIPFEIVIKALCDTTVKKFDPGVEDNISILDRIVQSMRLACKCVQKNPVKRQRPNEVGNDMEPFVINALKEQGMEADRPKTISGKGKTTGYPDVEIKDNGRTIYLEIKTYAAKNHKTTQRSFYLSPCKDHKVSDNGYHLLVGFQIKRKGDQFIPVAFEIVDLYGLDCDMKAEFNSDNRRLYEANRILACEQVA